MKPHIMDEDKDYWRLIEVNGRFADLELYEYENGHLKLDVRCGTQNEPRLTKEELDAVTKEWSKDTGIELSRVHINENSWIDA